MRVLVVDDAVDVATWLADELDLLGIEARVAHDASMALQQLESFDADVMLVDIALPGTSGWQLARQIRQVHATRPRLIAISAMCQDAHVQQSKLLGFEEHLVKPIKLDDLKRLLLPAEVRAQPLA
jgi:DNA-binding response OmpR family regulator